MPEPPTVLVTGGAKRIGAAISQHLADVGYRVAVHANASMDEAAALASSLDGVAVAADLTDPAAAEALVDSAADALGAPVDHVVNNASAFPRKRLDEATYEDVDTMMRLHAWAPLAICRAAARQGASSGVHITDTRVVNHDPAHAPYLMSKQSLHRLTPTLARSLAPMRINAVAPGPILAPTDGSGDDLAPAIKATLLGRAGRPDEVAEAVRFLLEAEYVTGNTLFVDGGRHVA